MNLPGQLVAFLALTFGPAITSAARPAVTFAAVQLLVAGAVRFDLASLPPAMGWLISIPAIAVALTLAVLETAAHHDGTIADLVQRAGLQHLLGAFGAFSSALLFSAMGLPEEEAARLGDAGPTGDLAAATYLVASAEVPTATKVGVLGAALGVNLGLSWVRGAIVQALADVELHALWARLETGGVLVVLALVIVLPWFAFALLVLAALAMALVGLSVRAASYVADRRARVACERCGHRVRAEASRCPSCHGARTPTVWLVADATVGQRFAALKTRLFPHPEPSAAT